MATITCPRPAATYLYYEHRAKKGGGSEGGCAWRLVPTTAPLQTNGYDCGVFATFCAHYLAHGVDPNFTQEHIPHLRRRMMVDILNKRIM